MTVHMITVVGGRVSVLPQMLDHYLGMGIDSVFLYVNLQSEQDGILETVRSIAGTRGIDVAGCYVGDWLTTQYELLRDVRGRYKSDWFIIADEDELHLYPRNLAELIEECEYNEYNYIQGLFVDRFASDGSLASLQAEMPLWPQYPVGAFFTHNILRGDPRKVAVVKGRTEMTNSGHHHSAHGKSYPPQSCLVQVHHFKWTDGLLPYLRSRCSNRLPDIGAVNKETERFVRYYEQHKSIIDLSDPRLLAAYCYPGYPDWDVVAQAFGQSDPARLHPADTAWPPIER